MLFLWGLSFGEALVVIAAAAIVFFIMGLWAGKSLFGKRKGWWSFFE